MTLLTNRVSKFYTASIWYLAPYWNFFNHFECLSFVAVWFYDKTKAGVLELAAEVGDSGINFIPAGSSVVIFNEQDTFGM